MGDDIITHDKGGPNERRGWKGETNNPSEISKPNLDKDGHPQDDAISSAKQAYNIAKSLESAAKARIDLQGVLMKKYGGEQPFDPRQLTDANQNWRNNFPTNFLAGIIDRVVPQYLDAIHHIKSLTLSSLPDSYAQSAQKSKIFQAETTKLVRAWTEWRDFANLLVTENVLLGYTTPCWIDPKQTGEWRPMFVKQDEAFVPEGTGQHPTKAQVFVVKKNFLLYEFVSLVKDKEAAEKAGYDIDNFIKATAKAGTDKPDSARDYADMMRECNLDASYREGTKTVNTYLVFVQEFDRGVDCWMVSQKDGSELRYIKDFAESMDEVTTFFTVQTGNGKLYGSKGLGRMLVNLHIAIDRSRNIALDSNFISQLCLVRCPSAKLNNVQFRIAHPFMFIDDNATEIQPGAFKFDLQSFAAMDDKLVQLAEQVAGAFIPKQISAGATPNTTIEAGAQFTRDEEIKQGVLSRFVGQFFDMVGTIQKKAYSETNIKEAKNIYDERKKQAGKDGTPVMSGKGMLLLASRAFAFIKKLMKDDMHSVVERRDSALGDQEAINTIVSMMEQGLDVQDIYLLAHTPASNVTQDVSSGKDAATLQFLAAMQRSPYMKAKAAFQMAAELTMGPDRAKAITIEQEDPMQDIIAIRQQNIEVAAMLEGEMMPVAPPDNHAVHCRTLQPKIGQIIQLIMSSPTKAMIATAEAMLKHYADHLGADIQYNGKTKKQLKLDIKFLQAADHELQKIQQEVAKAEAMGHNVEQLGMPQKGAPMTATGKNGSIPGDQQLKVMDLQIKKQDADRKDLEVHHKIAVDKHKLGNDVLDRGMRVMEHIDAASEAPEFLGKEASEE